MQLRILVSVLVLSAALAYATQPTPPKVDLTKLQDAASFHLLAQSELEKLSENSKGAFAAPGDPWAPTDVLSNGKTLPRQRVIWIAQSDAVRVVHYERGGFAHTYHVDVEEIDGTAFKLAWYATTGRLRDYLHFLSALNAGDIDPQPLPPR